MFNRHVGLCGVIGVLAACGGQVAGVTAVQGNSSPAGFITGRVFDSANGQPVSGATITAFVDGPVTGSSDVDGRYRLGPLPAGSYTVFFEGPGFLRRSFPIEIISGTMFPTGNSIVTLDADLCRPDATLEGQVVTSTGLLAKGASLFLDLRARGFELVAAAETDQDGKFKFEGMPGAALGQAVVLVVAPYDENRDGVPDFSSTSRSFSLFPRASTYNTVTLFPLGVQLINSNVSDGDVLPTEAITLTFSGAIRQNQTTVTLMRNSGSVQVGASLTWDPTFTVATLTPVGGNLVEGLSYSVLYNVKAVNGASTSGSLTFVARPAGGTPPLGRIANFRITTPAAYDAAISQVGLAWSPLANAAGYRIYGKDTATAAAYLLLSTVSSGATTLATVNMSLFDSVSGDAFITPLGHHNVVTLVIVALDRLGNETAFATAATIDLNDGVAPTVSVGSQLSGSANNLTGGSAATVQFQVTFSEVMGTDRTPQLTLPNAGTSAVWAWSAANRGTFTITIPAGIDGRGTLQIAATHDTSSNPQVATYEATLQ